MKQFNFNQKKKPIKYSVKNYRNNIGKVILVISHGSESLLCQEILPFDKAPLYKSKWNIHKSSSSNRWHGIIYYREDKPWEFKDYLDKDIFLNDMEKYYPEYIDWILCHLEWFK